MRPGIRRLAGATLVARVAWGGAASAAEGMPQLDFGNPLMLGQLVWLVIIFVTMYALLSRWALPQVASVLEHRASVIAADLEAARGAKAQADTAVDDLTRATREAQAAAAARVAEAVAQAKAAAARQAAEQNAVLDAQLAEAERRIGEARAAALGGLRQVASETATNLLARLTGRPADARSVGSEVDAAMRAAGHA